MTADGDVLPELLSAVQHEASNAADQVDDRGHGHYFVKKNTGKVQLCHNCLETLWGIWGHQGYICEVCNFTCHEKCLRTVASFCSGVAMQLIRNPVAHVWSEPTHLKNRCCNVCRKSIKSETLSIECEVCEYYCHQECLDLAVSNCKEAATYVPNLGPDQQPQHHHFREGNLPANSKCAYCRKICSNPDFLSGLRCEWCGITAHAACMNQLPIECNFGELRKIMLPRNCVSIPRTELPMEQLLNVRVKRATAEERNISQSTNRDASDVTESGSFVALLATPNRPPSEENSSTGLPEDLTSKDKEDSNLEAVRIYDGNTAFNKNTWRPAMVPKDATLDKLREVAMRTFHITDAIENYYVTQVVNEEGKEEKLSDLYPLRTATRKDALRVYFFLRYKSPRQESKVRIYGSWLSSSVTYCSVTINEETLAKDVISDAMAHFGLNTGIAPYQHFRLVEVSLSRGVVERTFSDEDKLLICIQELRRESLRRWWGLRLYIQESEDPRGTNVSLFVANLPPNLQQKQYERIILRLLGAQERPFSVINPIYYEYGAVVVTFTPPCAAKAASRACQILQSAKLVGEEPKERELVVICLPNLQPHMIPQDVEPLMVLVNVKSGGCQGAELMKQFRKLLNPFQVFDVLNGGPLLGLQVFRFVPRYKILVCGGDGTVGWVLQCLDNAGQDSACHSPPCAVLPLGTGNDLARVLRWGTGYTGDEDILQTLKDVSQADEVLLDRWTVVLHCEEKQQGEQSEHHGQVNPEDQSQITIMNNYFGIGIDADVCLGFHLARDKNPDKFTNRFKNKFEYMKSGMKKLVNPACKELTKNIRIYIDGQELKHLPTVEGIVILNIMSWGSGCNPWGVDKTDGGPESTTKSTKGWRPQAHDDGFLEVVGVNGVFHLGQIQSRLATGTRISQASQIRIVTLVDLPIQIDGEPVMQPPGQITIMKSFLTRKMLKKTKRSRRTGTGDTVHVGAMGPANPQQQQQQSQQRSPASTSVHQATFECSEDVIL